MSFTIGSLFDGSGGFPLAASMCGGIPLWASEVEPYPIAVTKSRFPNMKHLGSVIDVKGDEVEPVDVITFGSPCQDLSVAGKRAGLKHEDNGDEETTRSGLFMEAVRIIKEMRKATNGLYPRFAVWENVPGAFSSNKGEDFRTVCEELIKIVEPGAVMPAVPKNGWPYADVYCGEGWSLAYRVYDAQYWGVPQRRRRIYLVVDFAGECAGKISFERQGLRGYFETGRTPWQGIAPNAESRLGADDREGTGYDGYNGDLTGDKTAILGVNCGVSTGRNGVIIGNCIPINTMLATRHKQLGRGTGFGIGEDGEPQFTISTEHCHAVAYSFDSLASNSKVSPCMGQGNSDGGQASIGVAYSIENHPADSRVDIDGSGKVQTLTSRMGTGGGNVPMVLEQVVYRKGTRPHSADEAQKWEDADVANTLNTFDQGEARANELVVEAMPIHDQATRYSGKRGDNQDGKGNGLGVGNPGDPMNTLTSGDRHAVVYAVDQGGGKSGANFHCDLSPTLTCTHGGEPAVAFAMQAFGKYTETDIASAMKARDYKDATDLVCEPQAVCYGVDCRNMNETPELYPTLQAKSNGGQPLNYSGAVRIRYIVRLLTPTECARLQGFADRWAVPDRKDDFTDDEYQFWLNVRNTHAEINGKATKQYNKEQMLSWYNKLHTDSSEYKLWGNGIALPTALYVMQGISDVINQ